MPYSVVVAGGRLYRLSTSGEAVPLALPAGITLSTTRPPRFAVLGRHVIVTNNPLRSLCIGPDFSVRPLQLQPPVSPATLAGVGIGGLTGTYKVIYTHIVKDPLTGALLSESDFSPESEPATIATALLAASEIAASPDAATTHFRFYRTLADGSVYYNWIDLGVGQSAVEDDLSDVLLPNLSAPRELGVGPGMLPATYLAHLVEWKNRLWGVGDRDIDTVRYSGEGINYGWPATYGLDIKPIGGDDFGITGLMARRDLLGVGKRHAFWKISGGVTNDQGVPQWDVAQETNGAGVVGPNVVVGDTAYTSASTASTRGASTASNVCLTAACAAGSRPTTTSTGSAFRRRFVNTTSATTRSSYISPPRAARRSISGCRSIARRAPGTARIAPTRRDRRALPC